MLAGWLARHDGQLACFSATSCNRPTGLQQAHVQRRHQHRPIDTGAMQIIKQDDSSITEVRLVGDGEIQSVWTRTSGKKL
jgi:hypothetical protein